MKPGYDIEGVECIAEAKSGKSILVVGECEEFENDDSHDDANKAWIAKSQITEDSEVYRMGTSGTLIVTEWLAKKKGWL